MVKKLVLIFISAFFLNWLWENLHSAFYTHYQGAQITFLILLRAAIFDALFITILAILFWKIKFFRNKRWLVILIGFVFAIFLEFWALETGRWAYNSAMPIVPILGVGLTPVIQLGIIAYLVFWLADYFDESLN